MSDNWAVHNSLKGLAERRQRYLRVKDLSMDDLEYLIEQPV